MADKQPEARPMLHIVAGPTASGKEGASFALASRLGAEIISVDSMKIYRGLDIGTAKATRQQRHAVAHHCLDIADPENEFSVADYQAAADAAIAEVAARGKTVILCGGTALYYKALLEGIFEAPPKFEPLRDELKDFAASSGNEALFARLTAADPQAAAKLHPNDVRRVVRALEIIELTGEPISSRQKQWSGFHDSGEGFAGALRYPFKMVFINRSRPELYQRIEARVDKMLELGLEGEARVVWQNRDVFARTPLQAVGYKEFFSYFENQGNFTDAVELLKKNTRHLAKSQCTWFRKFPAQEIVPAPSQSPEDTADMILRAWSM